VLKKILSERQARHLVTAWSCEARADQLPPDREWNTWLFLGGRGAGKTRAGAEWVAGHVRTGRAVRVALIAATHSEARSIMIEGQSGLLSVSEGADYEPSLRRVTWPGSGAMASVLSADEPDSLRGHQFEFAWADEFAKWPDAGAALDMLRMGLRLGDHPQLMITTTPRPLKSLIELAAAPDTIRTHATTFDNASNLPANFLQSLKAQYGGTRLGRQELDGEIIEDAERAWWRRDMIDRSRAKEAPSCDRVVVAVDPPASRGGGCGIVAVGQLGGQAYVLGDYSKDHMGPSDWAGRAADAYLDFEATCLIAEANQGGDMVENTLRSLNRNMKVKKVHAAKSKMARAEPVAALYEQDRVHHVGHFAQLEDQMCQYDGTGPSPDRYDALVWALTELFLGKPAAVPMARFV
jgi:phage terminase large subunit-like protein